MRADKGNCFVAIDKSDYHNKMESLLSDRNTYELISTPPFHWIECELNVRLSLKKQKTIDGSTHWKLLNRWHTTNHSGICQTSQKRRPSQTHCHLYRLCTLQHFKISHRHLVSTPKSQWIFGPQFLMVFPRNIRYYNP